MKKTFRSCRCTQFKLLKLLVLLCVDSLVGEVYIRYVKPPARVHVQRYGCEEIGPTTQEILSARKIAP